MKGADTLTQGPVGRTLLKFAVPILCGNVLQSLNGSVNAIWVGRYLGEAALTAASNSLAVFVLLSALASGITTAAAILVGQCIGSGNDAAAKRAVGTSATFFTAFAAAVTVAGVGLSRRLLALMNVPEDSLSMSTSYLEVMFLAVPSMYLHAFMMSIVVAAGDAKTPFYFMSLSVLLDIVLNPVFIFGVGPIPGVGLTGSAIATFVSQSASLAALILYLYWRRHPLRLLRDDVKFLRPDRSIIMMLIRKGFPMSAQTLVASMSGAVMITLVNQYGVDATAAFGASVQYWVYLQMPSFAIGTAVAMMAAQNVGGNQWDRVNSIARIGVAYSLVLTSFVVLLFLVLDSYLYRVLLPPESPAVAVASQMNTVIVWSFVLMSVPIVLFGVVRAAGAVMVPLAIHAVSLLAVRLPFATMLIDRWQEDAIWWSFPISSAFSLVLAVMYYRFGSWRAVSDRTSMSEQRASVISR